MKAYLILGDGSVYEGEQIGKQGETIGEAVFTTAMGGYMETLTDPSYFGQIIMQTFPMIGNYGAITADTESKKVCAHGYIVRELCPKGSNFRKECELDDFLKREGVIGIAGIDTRELTKKMRGTGAVNAMITDNVNDLEEKLQKIRVYKVKNAVQQTSTKEVKENGEGRMVVLYDFGAKLNIERELIKRGCKVVTVPYNTTAKQVLELKPEGVVLSNGGGDPSDNPSIINETAELFKAKIPMLGICLGHQLMCLAIGAKTKKLKRGHRGANQPVKDLESGRVYITCQNHGYAVSENSLDALKAKITMVNANDKTCEAVRFLNAPAFSAQFHPEACSGPHDTTFLFDNFIKLIDNYNGKHCKEAK